MTRGGGVTKLKPGMLLTVSSELRFGRIDLSYK